MGKLDDVEWDKCKNAVKRKGDAELRGDDEKYSSVPVFS
jgi:hypothetical protein